MKKEKWHIVINFVYWSTYSTFHLLCFLHSKWK